jgi:predicted small secreted protein
MKSRVAHVTLAAAAVVLAACSGSGEDDSTLASRLARAASRTIVDVVQEIDGRVAGGEEESGISEPLRLVASRPDSIVDEMPPSPDAIEPAAEDLPTTPGHVVIATTMPEFPRRCGERRFQGDVMLSTDRTEASKIAWPLTRARAASLTRI